MCLDPGTAIQIGSAIFSFAAQSAQASRVDTSVMAANDADNRAVAERYKQVDAEATDKMSARAREARVEQARIRAIAGDSGLAGISSDRLIDESLFNEGTDIASIEANRRATLTQTQREAEAVNARNQTSINKQARPNLIGTGLQIAGAVVDADTRKTARETRIARGG